MSRVLCVLLLLGLLGGARSATVARAVARIVSPDGVDGLVTFEEVDGGVHVVASIEGLSVGPHGFHVHQYGDIRELDTLDTLGYHFIYSCELDTNSSCADDQSHGLPPSQVRHPGDMGNLQVPDAGAAAEYDDILGQGKLSLSNALKSIVGRAVLVHMGNDTGVQPYGNAGGPKAAGVIGVMNTDEDGDTNEAVGPDVPAADRLGCVLAGGDGVAGELLVSNLFSSEDLRVQFNISGLPKGDYTVAIHTYGDLTDENGGSIGDVWSSDLPTTFDFSVSGDQSDAGSVAFDGSFDKAASLRDAIGRACALHAGDADGDIVAVGVVGLAHIDAGIVTNVQADSKGSLLSPLSLLVAALVFLSLSRLH